MRLALTSNEPRSKYLFAELRRQAEVVAEFDFDDIDIVTKYLAALLSYDRPRSEWWENYQMHSLLQRRRRTVLRRNLARAATPSDALLMWGSWFHPTRGQAPGSMPFFNYIDQSRALAPLPEEPAASILHRKKSHALQAETYRASSGIFCMSEWARQQTLDAHEIDQSKVHAVGWGPCSVDLSSEPDDGRPRELKVLHVSNDFHRKGVDYLIATAERVAQREPRVRFLVIGKDGSKMPLRGGPANVEFTGPMRGGDLESHFRTAAAFLLPHRFDRSPHVLVEAMSAGLPMIASAQGGAIELIEGRETGFLVKSGDIDGYAHAVVSLMQNHELQRKMGSNARALMRAKYNWPSVARAIIDLIKTAAAP